MPETRQRIDRQHVHEIHHENPDEYRQRQRSDELAAVSVVDHRLGLVVHHLHENFHRSLKTPGNSRRRSPCGAPQQKTDKSSQQDTDHHGVEVDHREVNDGLLLVAGVVEMNQMVPDVFTRGQCVSFSSHVRLYPSTV
ncbi:hypothetical protein D9M68_819460 [compost metagenome]